MLKTVLGQPGIKLKAKQYLYRWKHCQGYLWTSLFRGHYQSGKHPVGEERQKGHAKRMLEVDTSRCP